jgi:DedD protein
MPLTSLFKRKPASATVSPSAPSAGDEPPLVAAARVRARRRLIGAVVLLGLGIIGFPLLFETAPRPIPVDIPIEIPRQDGVAPLTMPPVPAPRAAASGSVPPTAAIALPPDAGAELPASAAAAPASTPSASATAAAVARAPASAPQAAAKASAAAAAKPPGDGQRARALLDGTAAAAPAASGADDKAAARFVVQVGAYTDATALREARAKVEKLGLKTYTQVVETEAGKRTRVRTGPFASREEADAVVRTLKAAGLPGNILAL